MSLALRNPPLLTLPELRLTIVVMIINLPTRVPLTIPSPTMRISVRSEARVVKQVLNLLVRIPPRMLKQW